MSSAQATGTTRQPNIVSLDLQGCPSSFETGKSYPLFWDIPPGFKNSAQNVLLAFSLNTLPRISDPSSKVNGFVAPAGINLSNQHVIITIPENLESNVWLSVTNDNSGNILLLGTCNNVTITNDRSDNTPLPNPPESSSSPLSSFSLSPSSLSTKTSSVASLSAAAISGIITGVIVVVLITILSMSIWCRKYRRIPSMPITGLGTQLRTPVITPFTEKNISPPSVREQISRPRRDIDAGSLIAPSEALTLPPEYAQVSVRKKYLMADIESRSA